MRTSSLQLFLILGTNPNSKKEQKKNQKQNKFTNSFPSKYLTLKRARAYTPIEEYRHFLQSNNEFLRIELNLIGGGRSNIFEVAGRVHHRDQQL